MGTTAFSLPRSLPVALSFHTYTPSPPSSPLSPPTRPRIFSSQLAFSSASLPPSITASLPPSLPQPLPPSHLPSLPSRLLSSCPFFSPLQAFDRSWRSNALEVKPRHHKPTPHFDCQRFDNSCFCNACFLSLFLRWTCTARSTSCSACVGLELLLAQARRSLVWPFLVHLEQDAPGPQVEWTVQLREGSLHTRCT